MKKIFIIPFAIIALISCEETYDNKIEELQNEAEILAKNGANNSIDFNDALVSEWTLVEVEMYKIVDLDERNVPEAEFVREIKKSLEAVDQVNNNLNKMEVYSNGGKPFLESLKKFVEESRKVIMVYSDNSTILSIPEDDWTNEDIDNFNEVYLAAYQEYVDADTEFGNEQIIFANLNNFGLEIDEAYQADVIYEESKEK